MPLDGRTSGSIARGTSNSASTSGSQSRVCRLNNCVREAFVWSQACTDPPVRFHVSQLSMVPAHSSPFAARRRPSGSESSSQRILLAEKSGSIVRPVRCSSKGRAPLRRSSSQKGAVRRHCHTITGPSGAPVARSHTSTDSRWLLMPTASTEMPGTHARHSSIASSTVRHSGQRVLLDPSGLREADVDGPAGSRRRRRPARRTAGPSCWSCPGRSPARGVGTRCRPITIPAPGSVRRRECPPA